MLNCIMAPGTVFISLNRARFFNKTEEKIQAAALGRRNYPDMTMPYSQAFRLKAGQVLHHAVAAISVSYRCAASAFFFITHLSTKEFSIEWDSEGSKMFR